MKRFLIAATGLAALAVGSPTMAQAPAPKALGAPSPASPARARVASLLGLPAGQNPGLVCGRPTPGAELVCRYLPEPGGSMVMVPENVMAIFRTEGLVPTGPGPLAPGAQAAPGPGQVILNSPFTNSVIREGDGRAP